MRSRLLLIDGDNLVHRSSHALSSFRNDAGELVGGVFGSMSAMLGYVSRYITHVPIIFWDDRSRGRLRTYPAYKSNREVDEFRIEIRKQIEIVRRVFRYAGLRSVFVPGFEADDLIAAMAKRNPSTIMSTDKDFLQLLSFPGTFVDRGRTMNQQYNATTFERHYEVTPSQYRISQALSGDKSDGIIGIGGVGEIKAGKNGAAKKILCGADSRLFDLPCSDPGWMLLVDRLLDMKSKIAEKVLDRLEVVIRNYRVTELVSDRFAPTCARQAMRAQILDGYTGVRIKKVSETMHDLEPSSWGCDDLDHLLWTIANRNEDLSEVIF